MDGDQMKRIEKFLKTRGLDTGSLPEQRIKQLQKVDGAIQKRLAAVFEARQALKDNSISVAAIAADSGITRKTFYNNEVLKKYVESFSSVDGEPGKLVKASEIDSMKKRLDEQADAIAKMAARDVDIEAVRHETDELRKVIDGKDRQIRNLTEMYESVLAELHEERAGGLKSRGIELNNRRP